MKLSFDSSKKEYIGNYIGEYRNAGFLREISLKDAKQIRSDTLTIDYTNTRLHKYILELEEKGDEEKNRNFQKIIESFFFSKGKKITKSDYTEIEKILKEQYSEIKEDYINDFTLFVIYAKNTCFKEQQNNSEKWKKLFSKKLRNEIKQFYSDISDEKINVENITIEYNRDKYGSKKFVIDSPVIMKIMLYQFAKKYFTLFEKSDEDLWEQEIKFYDIIIEEKRKAGRPKNFDTETLKSILQFYWSFLEHENILQGDELLYKKYDLIGKLLSVAGYEKYDELKYDYKSKNDFYYKRLKKFWKPEGTK